MYVVRRHWSLSRVRVDDDGQSEDGRNGREGGTAAQAQPMKCPAPDTQEDLLYYIKLENNKLVYKKRRSKHRKRSNYLFSIDTLGGNVRETAQVATMSSAPESN